MRGLSKVLGNLAAYETRKKVACAAYAKMAAAPQMEASARARAPWHDISGMARKGLKGGVVMRGDKVIIYIAHSVDYGVYLELCNDKKYEILDPTVDRFKGQVKSAYTKIMRMP